ncbi:MAG: hypothetical protein FJW38_15560 [Acidobacteria bacterium]|nr:hypothetical protein [Acidobacteriota bacterium]
MISRRAFLAASAAGALSGAERDRYGGWNSIRANATGYFRVEEIRGRWYLITPEGNGYIAIGANHIGAYLRSAEQSGPLLKRAGESGDKALALLIGEMKSLGLTAGEAYAPLHAKLGRLFPRIENINYPTPSKFEFDVFDPAVVSKIHDHTVSACRAFASDPWVIGVAFADQPVWDSRRVDHHRNLAPTSPGRTRYAEFLRSRYTDAAACNAAYGTAFSSLTPEEDFKSIDAKKPAVKADDEAFLGIIADRLYGELKAATRKGAPNHLFLGERFVVRQAPSEVIRAVGRHVDIHCTQALILSPQRPPEWQVFQADGYRTTYAQIGQKPVIVIDWAAPFSLDTTYETERGVIKSEAESGDDAAAWIRAAFEEPYLVGLFTCQLAGRHGNDRWFPEGRMKRTLLRDDGTPFPQRTQRIADAQKAVLRRVFGP